MPADMNWEQVLEKVRTTEDKSWLAEYMPELCSPETLQDTTRLRVLGNAVANNTANREYLLNSKFAKDLLEPSALNLSILLNFCIDFPPAGTQLFVENSDKFREVLCSTRDDARVSAKNLLGAIVQEIDISTQSIELRRKLVLDGFIEMILVDGDLEQDPEILSNFASIYNMALDLENFLDAMQVVGNISSHRTFTIEHAEGVDPAISPIFFIILANLTGALANVPAVLAKFPDGLQLVLDFVDSDDFEHDEYNSCAHFLRNVGRVEELAPKISESAGLVDMVEDLIESPFAEVGIQLIGVIGQHVAHFDWFQILAEAKPDPSINAALLVSYSQLCIPLGSTASEDPKLLEPAVKKIIELLEATPSLEQTTSLWLKASKALALLSRHVKVPSIQHLKESAPKVEGVEENFKQVNSQ